MITLMVIGLFATGAILGVFLRRKKRALKLTEHLVMIAVYALLFFLGVSVGSDSRVINNITTLGWQAAALGSGAILGSLLLVKLLTILIWKQQNDPQPSYTNGSFSAWQRLKNIIKNQSLWILLFFIFGVVGTLFGWLPPFLGNEDISTGTLYVLMIFVGIGIGGDLKVLQILKQTSFHIILVPIMVVAGSIGGSLLVSFLLSEVDAFNGMAIGSGFGYYSLSAIFIGKISGSEMGVIALLSNIFREVITLMAAPLMVRWFGKLGAIASGGATAMDTTLPVIVKATGKEYAVISIFSGVVLSMLVPVLVPLILGH